jgi:predicted Mrr-cat superfamily restriction endonuclease
MALWLVRAGSSGEYEKKFLDENRIYLTWDDLNGNLQEASAKEDVMLALDILTGNWLETGTGQTSSGRSLKICK